MKRLYINFDFEARVHGIKCRCNGSKGYDIVNDDGSLDASKYMEALNRITCILKTMEDALITFGDDLFIGDGLGRSYGRLIRNWIGGGLQYVIWDSDGNIMSQYESDGSVTDRKLTRSFLDIMIQCHKAACGMET